MTDLTQTTTVIFDPQANAIETLYPGDDFFATIDTKLGKSRGDIFHLAHQTLTGKLDRKQNAGSFQTSEVWRPDYTTASLDIVETWKWTGRKWQKQ